MPTDTAIDEQLIHSFWETNRKLIKEQILDVNNIDYMLSNSVIRQTMFCDDPNLFQKEILYMMGYDNNNISEHIIDESKKKLFEQFSSYLFGSSVGNPFKINNCDTNNVHHVSHLFHYANKYGFEKLKKENMTIIEFGGGYGNMCRLLKEINTTCKYIIIDLPELIQIQKMYLEQNNLTVEINQFNQSKDVCLFDIEHIELLDSLKYDMFLSTWAVTETPIFMQEKVAKLLLPNCDSILVAYHKCGDHIPFMDTSLNFEKILSNINCEIIPNTLIPGRNFYAML